MATRGNPNLVRYHRPVDRSPEKDNDTRNLAHKQTLFAIRSEMENKLMQMNELRDNLEDSEKCLQKERESRMLAEERLQLVDMYNNPDINTELRHRLPRASDVDPFRHSSSVIQDSPSVLQKQNNIQPSSDVLKPVHGMQQASESHLINSSEVAEIPLSQNGGRIHIADDPLAHGNKVLRVDGDPSVNGGNRLHQIHDDPLTHNDVILQLDDQTHDSEVKSPLSQSGNKILQAAADPVTDGGNLMLDVTDAPITNDDMLLQRAEGENPTQRYDQVMLLDHVAHSDKVAEGPLANVDRILQKNDDRSAHSSETGPRLQSDDLMMLSTDAALIHPGEVAGSLLPTDDSILQLTDVTSIQNDGTSYSQTSETFKIKNKESPVIYDNRLSSDTGPDTSNPSVHCLIDFNLEPEACNAKEIGHQMNQDITSKPIPQHVEIPSQYSQTSTPSCAVTQSSQNPSSKLSSIYFQNKSLASPTYTSLPAGQVSSRSGLLASCMLTPVEQVSSYSRTGSLASQAKPIASVVSSHGCVMSHDTPYSCKDVPGGHMLLSHGNISGSVDPLPARPLSSNLGHTVRPTENSNHVLHSIPGTRSAFHSIPTVQNSLSSVHSAHSLFSSTPATSAVPLSSSFYIPPFIPPSSSLPGDPTVPQAIGGHVIEEPSMYVPGGRPQDYLMIPSSDEDILRELRAAMNTIEKMNENYLALQQENEQLKFCFKQREASMRVEFTERLSSLTHDLLAAQEVRDAAMMEKGAMMERECIAEADAIFSRTDESSSFDEDGDFPKDAFSSDNRNIINEQGKQLLAKIKCLNTANNVNMESLIQERNNAIFKCNMLQSELREHEINFKSNLTGDELTDHQDKMFKLQEKCEYWKNRVKELEDESINLRVYYSLHKSLSQETALKNSLKTFEDKIVKTKETLSSTQRENRWLMDQLRAVTAQRDEERARYQNGCHSDKEKISKLERKVTVLQNILREVHEQHRTE